MTEDDKVNDSKTQKGNQDIKNDIPPAKPNPEAQNVIQEGIDDCVAKPNPNAQNVIPFTGKDE